MGAYLVDALFRDLGSAQFGQFRLVIIGDNGRRRSQWRFHNYVSKQQNHECTFIVNRTPLRVWGTLSRQLDSL